MGLHTGMQQEQMQAREPLTAGEYGISTLEEVLDLSFLSLLPYNNSEWPTETGGTLQILIQKATP
jgi:hypothetical protein